MLPEGLERSHGPGLGVLPEGFALSFMTLSQHWSVLASVCEQCTELCPHGAENGSLTDAPEPESDLSAGGLLTHRRGPLTHGRTGPPMADGWSLVSLPLPWRGQSCSLAHPLPHRSLGQPDVRLSEHYGPLVPLPDAPTSLGRTGTYWSQQGCGAMPSMQPMETSEPCGRLSISLSGAAALTDFQGFGYHGFLGTRRLDRGWHEALPRGWSPRVGLKTRGGLGRRAGSELGLARPRGGGVGPGFRDTYMRPATPGSYRLTTCWNPTSDAGTELGWAPAEGSSSAWRSGKRRQLRGSSAAAEGV